MWPKILTSLWLALNPFAPQAPTPQQPPVKLSQEELATREAPEETKPAPKRQVDRASEYLKHARRIHAITGKDATDVPSTSASSQPSRAQAYLAQTRNMHQDKTEPYGTLTPFEKLLRVRSRFNRA